MFNSCKFNFDPDDCEFDYYYLLINFQLYILFYFSDKGLGLGSICGIVLGITFGIFGLWSINKYIKQHPHENCGEKITNICHFCGCTANPSTSRTLDISSNDRNNDTRWERHNGGFYNDNDERTFSARDASIFYNHGPYPAVNISSLGPNRRLNQLRTHDGLSVLPPSYDACMQQNSNSSSIHGFPDATQHPSSVMLSSMEHEEIPSSPPPSYEAVVGGNNTEHNGLNSTPSGQTNNALRTLTNSSYMRENSTDQSLTPVEY